MVWGRLALLQAAGESSEVLHKTALVLGYEFMPPPAVKADKLPTVNELASLGKSENLVLDTEATVMAATSMPKARWVRVARYETLDTTAHQQMPSFLTNPKLCLVPASQPAGTYCFAKPTPLVELSRLTPFLLNNLGRTCPTKRLDHKALSQRLAQGKTLARLPRLKQQRWPLRLQILVDAAVHLEPFWTDFARLARYFQGLLGTEAVQVLRFDESLSQQGQLYVTPWLAPQARAYDVWRAPAPEVAVLVLSDVGLPTATAALTRLWLQVARQLRHHPAPVIALSPQVAAQGNTERIRMFKPQAWNDTTRLGRHGKQGGFHVSVAPEVVEEALCFLSVLPVMDTGLLRALRLKLHWGSSVLEALLWGHTKTQRIGLGLRLREAYLADYQQRYLQHYQHSAKARQFWQTLKQHHQTAFEGLRQLERWHECVLEGQADALLSDYLQRLAATLQQSTPQHPHHAALVQQCRTFLTALPNTVWHSAQATEAYSLAALAYSAELKAGILPACLARAAHFDLTQLQWLVAHDPPHRLDTWQVMQLNAEGLVQMQRRAATSTGIALAEFQALPAWPPSLQGVTGAMPLQVLQDGMRVLLSDDPVTIRSSHAQLVLEAIDKPSWASRICYTATGLRATMPWLGTDYPIPWQAAENHKAGYWVWLPPFGEDQYGLYVDLDIKGIHQRFRWLEPGSFLMGSPASEVDRDDDEVQHQVTLTQGFWMADTTVTQAQWQAVMGNNPSQFQGKNRPVEQVSWQDTQAFIQKLNSRIPGFAAQLPREAQWEYACRAGTTTAFSFGDNITPEQVNYDGNYPYAKGQQGLYRQQTVPVQSLPANPWGLYEMHGNVWQWCQDCGQQTLPTKPVIDPPGLDTGVLCVVRGGSWRFKGRFCRSASRDWVEPDGRYGDVGFRLVLGHLSSGQVHGGVAGRGRTP